MTTAYNITRHEVTGLLPWEVFFGRRYVSHLTIDNTPFIRLDEKQRQELLQKAPEVPFLQAYLLLQQQKEALNKRIRTRQAASAERMLKRSEDLPIFNVGESVLVRTQPPTKQGLSFSFIASIFS